MRRLPVFLLVPLLGLSLLRAGAQDNSSDTSKSNRITVRSKARAVAPADEVELELVVQATGEDAKEAEKKHRDRLQKLLAALNGKADATAKDDDDEKPAKDDDDEKSDKKPKKKAKKRKAPAEETTDTLPKPGVPDEDGLVMEIKEGRYTLGQKIDPQQQLVEQMNPGQDTEKDVELSCGSCVHVTLKNLQKSPAKKVRRILATVLDRAADCGIDLGSNHTRIKPTLRFRVSDPEALKKKAFSEAITKGKARANDLAECSGLKIVKLASIADVPETPAVVTSTDDSRVIDFEGFLAAPTVTDPAAADHSSGSSEIAIEVSIVLEFEVK
ncbi:MAG TPA: SIMPL domain-containing protein [Planctomycetota bacterium]|nr:SIMPL domain-containing protein [Planctomycetota bacterium]